jgi:hypothetical protein
MSDAQFNFAVVGPLMFAGLGLAAYLISGWLVSRSR